LDSLLWEITGKGIKKPSYLYGTIHIQDKRVFSFDETVYDKFNSCEAFAMETIIDEIDPLSMQDIFMMKRHKLRDLMDEEHYKKLSNIIRKNFNSDISLFEKTKPIFITSQLIQFYEAKDMAEALDMHFLRLARDSGKLILGIEKFSHQLAAVNKIPVYEQCDMLKKFIDKPETIQDKYNELLDAYLSKDFKSIKKLIKDTSFSDNFNYIFISERNRKMARKIGVFCKKYSTFNAFGAGHLIGKESVISLLKEKGFNVKPIGFSFQQSAFSKHL
jgi:uncharacterized protein